MSNYTVMLRWVIEQTLNDKKLEHTEANWSQCYERIGLADYPIFDELYRETLNNKIIRAYYFRELGFETVGLFQWQMRRMMYEIMPYYNQLYASKDLVTEPMYSKNMDFWEKWTRDENISNDDIGTKAQDTTRTYEKDITFDEQKDTIAKTVKNSTMDKNTNTTTDSNTNSHSRNVFQDTPMNGLDTDAIENMDYATDVTFNDENSDTHTTSNENVHQTESETTDYTEGVHTHSKTDEDYVEKIDFDEKTTSDRTEVGDYDGTKVNNEHGYDIPQSQLLLMYRKTFINIDLDIVKDLNVLFMGLW